MADASSVNELVPTTNAFYACWRLTRVLIAAGWTVSRSSNGTSFGAADNWTTYAGLGTSSWIVLNGPGVRQFCFWRDTTSNDNGKVIYAKSGSFAYTGAYSASNPGDLPATANYIRGASGSFNSWFGGAANAIKYLSVVAKDCATDGSWWICGSTPVSVGAGTYRHFLAWQRMDSFDPADTDPFISMAFAASNTANSPSQSFDGGSETSGASSFYGWARNSDWKPFNSYNVSITNNVDRNPYTAGNPYVLDFYGIFKSEANFNERKGYVKNVRIVGATCTAGDTFSDGATPYSYVRIAGFSNPFVLFHWDGVTPAMAID